MYAMLTGKLPYSAEPFHITTLYNKMKRNDMNPIPDHLSSCKFIFITVLSFLSLNRFDYFFLLDQSCHNGLLGDGFQNVVVHKLGK